MSLVRSYIDGVLSDLTRGLPEGSVEFSKRDAQARVNSAKNQLITLARANGYAGKVAGIEDVFAVHTAGFGTLPEDYVFRTTSEYVKSLVEALASGLEALAEAVEVDDESPDFEDLESPVVEEVHGYDDDLPYDGWDGIEPPVENPFDSFLVEVYSPRPEPVAELELTFGPYNGFLRVQGPGAQISFDGAELLVTL